MDLQYLRRLIKIFDDSTATDLTIEEEGTKVALSRKNNEVPTAMNFPQGINFQQYYPQQQATITQPPVPATGAAVLAQTATAESSDDESGNLHKINSPIVGTFYRSPSPDSGPFVEVGDHVTAGSTLCIVEAMKLMNEIESDISGTIVKILVDNSQPVEYNQAMFLVKPD